MLYYVNGETVNIVVADDMPYGLPEHIWINHDGSYTIRLNAKYNYETLQYALSHAIEHIKRGDFFKKGYDVNQIEYEAHKRKGENQWPH